MTAYLHKWHIQIKRYFLPLSAAGKVSACRIRAEHTRRCSDKPVMLHVEYLDGAVYVDSNTSPITYPLHHTDMHENSHAAHSKARRVTLSSSVPLILRLHWATSLPLYVGYERFLSSAACCCANASAAFAELAAAGVAAAATGGVGFRCGAAARDGGTNWEASGAPGGRNMLVKGGPYVTPYGWPRSPIGNARGAS